MVEVNYLAVVVAGVVSFVLGGLWYSPMLFGKIWLKLSNVTPEQMEEAKKRSMVKSYMLTFIGSLVMASVLSKIIFYAVGFLQDSGVWTGICVAFSSWIGFIAPSTLNKVLWDKQPWTLWIIDNAYYLVSLVLMSVVFTLWM